MGIIGSINMYMLKGIFRPIIQLFLIWYVCVSSYLFIVDQPMVHALNKTSNWNFASNATGWTATNGTGTDVCGKNLEP